ncbi:MAG: DUF3015 family protein [Alphaproteobacteria bacterium]|nr:DUF3015 family protein [Alphaproteobacteria bacterium]MDD9919831.1 DUF3015 family protein [Alphaproteobacteria bacterium]
MKKLFILAALLALPMLATAEENETQAKKVQGSGPNPFTECGIGAALFPEIHWAAALSNVIWDLGSTAVTSALSSPEMCNEKKKKTAKFIIETLPQLEQDIAAGNGQYIAGLAETMGCAGSQDAIASGLRTSYTGVVANGDYATATKAERATTMYNAVKTVTANVDGSCAVAL